MQILLSNNRKEEYRKNQENIYARFLSYASYKMQFYMPYYLILRRRYAPKL